MMLVFVRSDDGVWDVCLFIVFCSLVGWFIIWK